MYKIWVKITTVLLMACMFSACTPGYPQGSKKHTYSTDYSSASADQNSNLALKRSIQNQQNTQPAVPGPEITTPVAPINGQE